MALIRVNTGDQARAIHVQQLIDLLQGSPGTGIPISFTEVNNAATYALSIRNLDPTYSKGFIIYKNDNIPLLIVDSTGVQASVDGVASAAGQFLISSTGIQTLTNKTFTRPVTNDWIDLVAFAGTPVNPGVNKTRFYTKADGYLYFKPGTAGVEERLGTAQPSNDQMLRDMMMW